MQAKPAPAYALELKAHAVKFEALANAHWLDKSNCRAVLLVKTGFSAIPACDDSY